MSLCWVKNVPGGDPGGDTPDGIRMGVRRVRERGYASAAKTATYANVMDAAQNLTFLKNMSPGRPGMLPPPILRPSVTSNSTMRRHGGVTNVGIKNARSSSSLDQDIIKVPSLTTSDVASKDDGPDHLSNNNDKEARHKNSHEIPNSDPKSPEKGSTVNALLLAAYAMTELSTTTPSRPVQGKELTTPTNASTLVSQTHCASSPDKNNQNDELTLKRKISEDGSTPKSSRHSYELKRNRIGYDGDIGVHNEYASPNPRNVTSSNTGTGTNKNIANITPTLHFEGKATPQKIYNRSSLMNVGGVKMNMKRNIMPCTKLQLDNEVDKRAVA
eukprot:CAMPEP_0197244848 /NCGR_PEP_ID=MMETSP1429-20130617/9837_1 /TAXON_ID=49237 /ORGANISM="Chaetoceros  sp., Strain UNC1202" /LENGTH=328 /DNA_ID=CAMNT_0042705261 /DNA_START=113 /DNA_END=1100 /DNA_ORIENTATION=+